jgi:shikimate kinase
MSVRVELIGAPGSGKTTLAAALCRRRVGGSRDRIVLADRLALVPRRPVPGLARLLTRPGVIGALAGAPRLANVLTKSDLAQRRPAPEHDRLRAFARALRPSGPRGEAAYRSEALGWLDLTFVLVDLAERVTEGVVPLLEEGLAQRTLSVLGASTERERHELLRMLPAPRLLVHLRASPELLAIRARERLAYGSAPVLHRGRRPEEVTRLVAEDAAALEQTAQFLVDQGWEVMTLTVDGADADEQAGEVVERLTSDGRR